MSERLGIYGGTFDPVHCAHLEVARVAADRFGLERVLFVPAAVPPHKAGAVAPYVHRLAMVRLACAADWRFEASDIEADEPRSYSILTIEKLRRERPDARWFFIIGADAFAEVGTWHRWRDVVSAVEFIVVTRPGHAYTIPEGARVHPLDGLALPVSSSALRGALARGEKPREVPGSVQAYIEQHGLYSG